MHPTLGNAPDNGSVQQIVDELIGERMEALAGWIHELDAQLRTTAVAGNENTLKELRRALEAWSKRDPKFEERLTERVDVLADRLATLSSTVNTTAAAHAGSDGELASLRRELEQETAKLHAAIRKREESSHAETVEELRRTVAKLSAGGSLKHGGTSVTGLQERIDNIGERVDTLAKTVASTAAGLAGREGELAALRRSLDDANAQIERLAATAHRDDGRSDAAELRARFDAVAQQVTTTTSTLAERDRAVAALASRVTTEAERLAAVTGGLREAEELLGSQLRSLDARVQDRLSALETRIDGASTGLSAKELELAALQRHLEETGARVEATAREIREALPETASLAELEDRLAPVQAQVEELAGRFQAAGALVQERLEGEASRLAELDVRLGNADRRLAEVDSLVHSVPEAPSAEEVAALARRLEVIEQGSEATATEVERSVSGWREEQAWVREQLDVLVQAVSETPTKSDVDESLAAVSARIKEAETRLDAAVRKIEADLAALPDPSLVDVEAKLEPFTVQLQALEHRLEEAERVATERLAAETASAAETDDLLASTALRLDAIERARETAAAEVERAAAAWNEEQVRVREQLDAVVQAVSETPTKSDVDEPLAAVAVRLEELEHAATRLAADLARADEAAAAERQALAARLDEVSAPASPISASEDEELRRLLTAFADRIEAIEAERTTARQMTRATQGELGGIRASLESLEKRLASAEEHQEHDESPEVESQIEALGSRLDSLEKSSKSARAAAAPVPGDGRLRVELRALELRMQHAEVAARENREAVLVQLERLAARLEWRLQRLESELAPEPDASDDAEPFGQVVPIRGGADT